MNVRQAGLPEKLGRSASTLAAVVLATSAGAVAAPSSPARDQAGQKSSSQPRNRSARIDGLLQHSRRQAFARTVRRGAVWIRRHHGQEPAITRPGGHSTVGAGWIIAPSRVLTASGLLSGWPGSRAVGASIEVISLTAKPVPSGRSGTVVLVDAELGLAVLDVPGLEAPGSRAAPASEAIEIGTHLYGVIRVPLGASPTSPPLVETVVLGRGEGPLTFYLRLDKANLPLGSPLFDASGQLAGIVGLVPLVNGSNPYLIPAAAVRSILNREHEWRP